MGVESCLWKQRESHLWEQRENHQCRSHLWEQRESHQCGEGVTKVKCYTSPSRLAIMEICIVKVSKGLCNPFAAGINESMWIYWILQTEHAVLVRLVQHLQQLGCMHVNISIGQPVK